MQTPVDKLTQLEADIQQLCTDTAAAFLKIKQQITIERRYEESQYRFQTIFYQSKLGNEIIAPDLTIVQINDVLLEMLGYSEQEIIGTKVVAYAHPDYIHHWDELQENLWTKQIPSFQIETCLVKKDGSILCCQVTSIVFRDNGANLGYTIVEDISERKALEVNLKKLYDYQETIMHMVAHDLKSPINNIISISSLLKNILEELSGVESETKAQLFAFIQMISDTSDRAYAIIQDLLLIGGFQSTQAFEKTDLKIFIGFELALLKLEAQKKGIAIRFHYPEEPVYAHINQEKFARVLENLLSNALKFTNVGGEVVLSLTNEGQRVLLQVSDTGIGIPEHLKASIFNKFTKANREGTEGETTTGLGLYIVKQILDIHKAKIWFESQENVGTSFFIELM
ncbi:MAG: ATP-binding protein [Bacteroidota bacterium]